MGRCEDLSRAFFLVPGTVWSESASCLVQEVQEDSRGPHDPQTKLTLPKVPDSEVSEVHAKMDDDLSHCVINVRGGKMKLGRKKRRLWF